MNTRGIYFDGQTPSRRQVLVQVEHGDLVLTREDGVVVRWPRGSFQLSEGRYTDEKLRIGRGDEEVVIDDHRFLAALGEQPARHRLKYLAISAAVLSGGLVWGYFFGLPALAGVAAERIPPSWEAKLGDSAMVQLAPESKRCNDPALAAAVQKIADRLASATPEQPYHLEVVVAKDAMVNAYAVPGGKVVIYTGLLEKTQRPEELAGILAHEFEHVYQKHPTRSLLRTLSLNAVIAVLAGDFSSLLMFAATLGDLRYQRVDEENADTSGMKRMIKAGIDPNGMVDAYRMLEKESLALPKGSQYVLSHPHTGQRIDSISAIAKAAPVASQPLLPGTDWASLAKSCSAP